MREHSRVMRVPRAALERGISWAYAGDVPQSSAARRRLGCPVSTITVAVAVMLASASLAAAATVTGSSRGLSASMHVGTHHPKVGARWPLQFTAKRSGRGVQATVTYEYLYDGQVVAVKAHHTFTGSFSDALVFPAQAVGYPLTFQAVITSGGSTVDLDYAIQVRR